MEIVKRFENMAEKSSAKVLYFKNLDEIMMYCIELVDKKNMTDILMKDKRKSNSFKTIAIDEDVDIDINKFALLCSEKNIKLIQNNLRDYVGGIDVGITNAEFGIARTGTVVVNTARESTRLLSMISEIHLILLKQKNILMDFSDIVSNLSKYMEQETSYISFITGPSRTADIERVLTLGVHGPEEVNILILEEL